MKLKRWSLVGILGSISGVIIASYSLAQSSPQPVQFHLRDCFSTFLETLELTERFIREMEMSILLEYRNPELQQSEGDSIFNIFLGTESEPVITPNSYLGREVRDYLYEKKEELNVCDGDDQFFYARGGFAQFLYRIENNKYIVEARCDWGNAGTWVDYYLYQIQPEGFKLTPLSFVTYHQESPESPIERHESQSIFITLRSYDTDQQIFSTYGRYMAVNLECGYFGRYQWQDSMSQFELIDYRLISPIECDDIMLDPERQTPPIEDFPVVYRANP